MKYYAKIKDGIVVAVTQTAGVVSSPDMIEIDGLLDIGGYTYNNGQFIAPVVSSLPQTITMRQARLALSAAGLLGTVNAAVANADEATRIEWEYAQTVNRNWPTLLTMANIVGLDSAQIDQIFILGATL
jgi:hypothetical protein